MGILCFFRAAERQLEVGEEGKEATGSSQFQGRPHCSWLPRQPR